MTEQANTPLHAETPERVPDNPTWWGAVNYWSAVWTRRATYVFDGFIIFRRDIKLDEASDNFFKLTVPTLPLVQRDEPLRMWAERVGLLGVEEELTLRLYIAAGAR